MKTNKIAQSVLEYVIILTALIGAFVLFQDTISRAVGTALGAAAIKIETSATDL